MNYQEYQSGFPPTDVTAGCIGPLQIFAFFFGIVGLIHLWPCLGLRSWTNPTFLLAVLLSTMVIVGVLFGLALAALVRVSSILTEFLDPPELLLLLLKVLLFLKVLLLTKLFLLPSQLLLSFPVRFRFASVHGGIDGVGVGEVENLAVFCQGALFLLGDFLVERLPVLLDRVFSVFINRYFDRSFVLNLLLLVVEVMQVGVLEGFLHAESVLRVKHQHFFHQVQCLVVHLRKK